MSDSNSEKNLPNFLKAKIDPEKFSRYSMDPSNITNQNKWIAFGEIGYEIHEEKGRWDATQDVMQQLRSALPSAPATLGKTTQYGQRYKVSRSKTTEKQAFCSQIRLQAVWPAAMISGAEGGSVSAPREPPEGGTTNFFDLLKVDIQLTGPNGKSGTLVTIWQIEGRKNIPRLITNWLEVHR